MSASEAKGTVLFMARDPEEQYSLVRHLTEEGYQVFARHTRERAAQLMSVYSLDLIIVDNDLTESSGIEYCHYLRSTRYAKVVPIIVIGHDDAHCSQTIAAYDAGCDDFIQTPVQFRRLSCQGALPPGRACETPGFRGDLHVSRSLRR